MRARQARGIFDDEVAQRGAMLGHAEREHGAPGDLQRHPLHRFAQIDRLTLLAGQFLDGFIGDVDHVRHQGIDRTWRERRRQRPPLMFPGLAFRQQQTFAEHRLQHANAGRSAVVVLVIVDQDVADAGRIIEGETAAAEKAALQHILLVGALAPGADAAFAHREQPAQCRHGCWCDRRARRDQRRPCNRDLIDFGEAHRGLQITTRRGASRRSYRSKDRSQGRLFKDVLAAAQKERPAHWAGRFWRDQRVPSRWRPLSRSL